MQVTSPITLVEPLVNEGDYVSKGQILLRLSAGLLAEKITIYQSATKQLRLALKQQQFLTNIVDNQLVKHSDIYAAQHAVILAKQSQLKAWHKLFTLLFNFGDPLSQAAFNKQLPNTFFTTSSQVSLVKNGQFIDKLAKKLSVVKAPFSGQIMSQIAVSGYRYQANEKLLQLAKTAQVYVTVFVSPEKQALWLQGSSQLSLDGASSTYVPLKLINQPVLLDTKTGLRKIIFIANNKNNQLHQGQWLEAQNLQIKQTVFWLPASAVVSRNNTSWCVIQRQNGSFKAEKVITGEKQNGNIPILKGLSTNQLVVTQNAYEILYGDLNHLIKFVD